MKLKIRVAAAAIYFAAATPVVAAEVVVDSQPGKVITRITDPEETKLPSARTLDEAKPTPPKEVTAKEPVQAAKPTARPAVKHDCDGKRGAALDVCEAYIKAKLSPVYRGPIAPTTQPMVCLSVMAPEPVELVVADGYLKTSAELRNAPALLRFREQSHHWHTRSPNVWLREICLPARLVKRHLSGMTICAGEAGRALATVHLTRLLLERRIPETEPACVGGSSWCRNHL